MNTFLPSRYSETVHRLALGIEPVDAVRGSIVPRPFDVEFDGQSIAEWRIDRHRSGRFAIRFARGIDSPVRLRLVDPKQRYVPRRIAFPIVALAAIEAAEAANDDVPLARRARRPALFPGAAYDTSEAATGIRGHVVRGGRPVRWARVEAAVEEDGVIGRGMSDEHGEFLLLLGPVPEDIGDLPAPLTVDVAVTVYGPAAVPVPATPDEPLRDPLWDVPREQAAAVGAVDRVSPGTLTPSDPPLSFTRTRTRALTLPLGRITSVRQPFDLT